MYSEHEYFYNHFRLQLRKEDNFASSLPLLLLLSCSLHSGKVFCIVKAYAKCGRKKKNLPNLCVFDSKAAVYICLLYRYELELKNYYSKISYFLTDLFCMWRLWLSAAVC